MATEAAELIEKVEVVLVAACYFVKVRLGRSEVEMEVEFRWLAPK
jgi:hypothetical protein